MRAMTVSSLVVFLSLASSLSPAAAEKSSPSESLEESAKFLYRDFKEVHRFGMIAVSLVGDAEKLGLETDELTELAKRKFKENFHDTHYDDVSKDSKNFWSLVLSKDKKAGTITFRVWVVGEDYPVVYHIRCDAGNFENPAIWSEEILGHGSRKSAPDAIRQIIGDMMKSFAESYFKVKAGEM